MNKRKITLIISCFTILLITICSTLLYQDYNTLKHGDDEWEQGLLLIKELKHKKALEQFEEVKNKLIAVKILFLKKQRFIKKIDDLTISQVELSIKANIWPLTR